MDALFAIPGRDETVLGLPAKESAWLVRALLNPPTRLFPATERLRSLFEEMFALYDAADMSPVEKRLKMRSCALAFLLAVADAPTATPAWRSRSHPALKAIVDRMRRDPLGRYPAAELAREAGLSEVRFFEAFKRETGFSPLAYRLDRRVRLAWRDIAVGASIGDAAARYGFSSPQHFSSVFKRIVGLTPRECRWKQPDLPG